MHIIVLGSAAGGGFPQWNGNDRLNRLARAGAPNVLRRTQSSLAASADGRNWVLFNASPDIREQIAANAALHPAEGAGLRATPIKAVVLTNADVDHIAGLLSLREREPFTIYATRRVLDTLSANSIFRVLDESVVPRIELPVSADAPVEIGGPDGPTGIGVEPFPVAGKVALFLETGRAVADFAQAGGDTLGLKIGAGGAQSVAYVPGCAGVDGDLLERIDGADVLFFDGTVYTDSEMIDAGVGVKTGQRMGHMAMSGPGGSIAALAEARVKRRVFVHMNNTNPVLDTQSAEHAAVRAAGWEVGWDGMEMKL